jgi:hypothetical protein
VARSMCWSVGGSMRSSSRGAGLVSGTRGVTPCPHARPVGCTRDDVCGRGCAQSTVSARQSGGSAPPPPRTSPPAAVLSPERL